MILLLLEELWILVDKFLWIFRAVIWGVGETKKGPESIGVNPEEGSGLGSVPGYDAQHHGGGRRRGVR